MESNPPRFTLSIGHVGSGEGPDAPVVVHKRGVDLRSAELLRHEREVLSRITHPGIVELAHDSEGAGPPTLSTYLAGNLTLADRPPTDGAAIARTGAQIATTLAELHGLGTAHGSVAPEHCVIGPGGSVVLCSLRRATDVSGPEHPAASRDVAGVVEMLRTWVADAPSVRRDRVTARVESVLASAARREPSARDLASALSVLDAPVARRRDDHPRRRPRRPLPSAPRPRRPERPLSGWSSAASLVGLLAAGIALWSLDLPDGSVAGSGFPPALWVAAEALRFVALVACGYLAALAALTIAASLTRDERLARAAERLGPRRVRRWAAGPTSLGVVGSAAAATWPTAPVAHRVDRWRPSPVPTSSTSTSTTTTALPVVEPVTPPSIELPPDPVPLVATPVGPAEATTWTVVRGDHLWGIAERTLAVRLGRPAGADEVRRYWTTLIEANRSRLADPSNPDLIFAGQVFVLPPD